MLNLIIGFVTGVIFSKIIVKLAKKAYIAIDNKVNKIKP